MAHFTNELGQHATVEVNVDFWSHEKNIVIKWDSDNDSTEMLFPEDGRFYRMRSYMMKNGCKHIDGKKRISKREYDFWMNIYEQGKKEEKMEAKKSNLKKYKIVYYLYPDAENVETTVMAKSYEDACIFAKDYRKEGFSCDEVE